MTRSSGTWPTMAEYQEAVQNPKVCFADASLRSGTPVLNKLGLPRPICGQFASVYEFKSGGSRWAIKCFLRNIPDLHSRYEKIAGHLGTIQLPYFMTFQYLQDGIKVGRTFYPIVKMEWIEGLQLNMFVEKHLNDRAELESLAEQWIKLLEDLRGVRVAHGDLQHGNVLVSPDQSLRLIDYDGMWVPRLKGAGSHETGHPDYQSPLRTGSDFHEGTDEFAGRVILVALRALARKPDLWKKYTNDDNLLFNRKDFADPKGSPLFADLRALGDPEIGALLDELAAACGAGPKRGLFTRLLRSARPAAPTGTAAAPPAAPARPAPPPEPAARPPAPAPAPPPRPQPARPAPFTPRPPVIRGPAIVTRPPPPRPAPPPVAKAPHRPAPPPPPPPRPAPAPAPASAPPRPAPAPPPPSRGGRSAWLDDHLSGRAHATATRGPRPGPAPAPRVIPARAVPAAARPASRPAAASAPFAAAPGGELSLGRRILACTRLALHLILLAPLIVVSALDLQAVLQASVDQAKAILTAGFGLAVIMGIVSLTTLYVVRAAHGMASTLFFGVSGVIMLLNVFSSLLTRGWTGWTGEAPWESAMMLTLLGASFVGLVIEFGCRKLNVVAVWRAPWKG